ncbi:MAG: lysophospholipid acyltransferase family protein [Tepidisphaeraceae bacterium]
MSISPAVDVERKVFSRRETDLWYRFLRAWAGSCARVYHGQSVISPCRLPRTGPAILVSNHISSIDPLLLQAFSPRLIRWMMAKEYFDFKPLRWLFDTVGVILVERSGRDMAATRAAMRALEAGYVLGVFPEGRIEPTNDLIPFQNGIGLLALKTRSPVFPAYIDGTRRNREIVEAFLRPSSGTIAFGARLELGDLADSRAGIEEATRRIQSAVEGLKNVPRRNHGAR